MKPVKVSENLAKEFRPAKHCRWIIRAFRLFNSLSLAWHNRLRLNLHDLETLKNIPKNSGLILTANHSDEIDPLVCFELSQRANRRFTCMINAEAFEQWRGVYGWWLQRLGGFSVERGGSDQAARRYAVEIVKNERDILVMFPEGEISYLNKRVQPFKTGAIHIGLQAITENRRIYSSWTAYILPVAIKYRYCKPIELILNEKMRAIEKRLLLQANFFTFQERIIRIMTKILKLPELNNSAQTISEQLSRLEEETRQAQAALLSNVESKYPQFKADTKARLTDRAQKIIFFLREELRGKKFFSSEATTQLRNHIRDLKKSIQMSGWQPKYIDLTPSEEQLAETVMKLEREVFGLKKPRALGNREVFVRIGNPVNLEHYVDAYQKNPSILAHQIAEELRDNIQLLIEGM